MVKYRSRLVRGYGKGASSFNKKDGQWFEWSSDGSLIVNGSFKEGKRWDGNFKGTKYISGEKQNF